MWILECRAGMLCSGDPDHRCVLGTWLVPSKRRCEYEGKRGAYKLKYPVCVFYIDENDIILNILG